MYAIRSYYEYCLEVCPLQVFCHGNCFGLLDEDTVIGSGRIDTADRHIPRFQDEVSSYALSPGEIGIEAAGACAIPQIAGRNTAVPGHGPAHRGRGWRRQAAGRRGGWPPDPQGPDPPAPGARRRRHGGWPVASSR